MRSIKPCRILCTKKTRTSNSAHAIRWLTLFQITAQLLLALTHTKKDFCCSKFVVDLDQTWRCQCGSSHITRAAEVAACSERSNAQALHDVCGEGEIGLEGDDIARKRRLRYRHTDGEVLACKVGDKKALAAALVFLPACRCQGQISAELERLVLRQDIGAALAAKDADCGKDGDVDEALIGLVKGTGRNEILESAEGERGNRGGQEGLLGGLETQERAVPAVLFALLSNHRSNSTYGANVAIGGKELGGILQSAQDDGRKSGSKSEGGLEVGRGEFVCARLRCECAKTGERFQGI